VVARCISAPRFPPHYTPSHASWLNQKASRYANNNAEQLASIFHEAMCVNVLAWFACACRIDERYRLGGLATLDRTHDAVATAPEGGRSAGR
jgi:hypothetical protein